jgi:hypothetical protein
MSDPSELCPIQASAGSLDQTPGVQPVEGGSGVGLSAGCNVAMSDHPLGRQARVRLAQRGDHLGERLVLGAVVGQGVGALEFDADRIIIARLPSLEAGFSGMPGAVGEFDVLRYGAIPSDHQVR